MNGVSPFLYGRSKNRDYRWLIPPQGEIGSNEIAKILEKKSRKLSKGFGYFSYQRTSDYATFCIFFNPGNIKDRFGRKISFMLGFEVFKTILWDFSFQLPNLILYAQDIVNLYLEQVTQLATSDNFNIESIKLPLLLNCDHCKSLNWTEARFNDIDIKFGFKNLENFEYIAKEILTQYSIPQSIDNF